MTSRDPVSVNFEVSPDESGYPPTTSETLWCIPTGSGTCVVDNIPFFVRDISLGDEIEVVNRNGVLHFSRLLKKSRNSTVRVLLRDDHELDRVRSQLERLGCGVEYMDNMKLLAVTLPPEARVSDALSFLDEEAELKKVGIEESSVRYQSVN